MCFLGDFHENPTATRLLGPPSPSIWHPRVLLWGAKFSSISSDDHPSSASPPLTLHLQEYTHKQLEKESSLLTTLQAEVTLLKERLAVFKKLPPSLALAEEQVRQLEVEIASVDLEINKKNM